MSSLIVISITPPTAASGTPLARARREWAPLPHSDVRYQVCLILQMVFHFLVLVYVAVGLSLSLGFQLAAANMVAQLKHTDG